MQSGFGYIKIDKNDLPTVSTQLTSLGFKIYKDRTLDGGTYVQLPVYGDVTAYQKLAANPIPNTKVAANYQLFAPQDSTT